MRLAYEKKPPHKANLQGGILALFVGRRRGAPLCNLSRHFPTQSRRPAMDYTAETVPPSWGLTGALMVGVWGMAF